MFPTRKQIDSSSAGITNAICTRVKQELKDHSYALHDGRSVLISLPRRTAPEAITDAVARLYYEGWKVERHGTQLAVSQAPWSFKRFLRRWILPSPYKWRK